MLISFVSETKVLLQCDVCSEQFERYASQVRNLDGFHFCPNVGKGRSAKFNACRLEAQKHNGIVGRKIRDVVKSKYGVESVLQLDVVREKIKTTCVERYGVDNPQKSAVIKQKTKNTVIDRYGVRNVFQLERIRKNCESETSRRKAFETKKMNGRLWKSIPEDLLYDVLVKRFGHDNVVRQAWIKRWPIDFYVKCIDTYIQYDSHWHGYDDSGVMRDLAEVAETKISMT